MMRTTIAVLAAFVIGGAGGLMLGVFLYPYWFPPAEVNEVVVGKSTDDVLANAMFIHANPSDPIHYGSGNATIYPDLVHLEADFEVGPGPKYHLYLVPADDVTPETPVDETMFVDLGRLKSFRGSQNYPIPAGIDIADYGSLVVWCEQFDVLISPARVTAR